MLPAKGAAGTETPSRAFSAGQSVSIEGILLAMPDRLRAQAKDLDKANAETYIYATSVK